MSYWNYRVVEKNITEKVDCSEIEYDTTVYEVHEVYYDEIIDKSVATCEIDNLVDQIKREFETMHNLYNTFVKELTGRGYSIFDDRVVNYKEVLKLEGLSFVIKDHGFSKAFFLTYKKPKFLWFSKHKNFYFVSRYDFHTEYESSTRYDFDARDYKMILGVLENENKRLQGMIENVRVKKLNRGK